jgi:hypothetical protein
MTLGFFSVLWGIAMFGMICLVIYLITDRIWIGVGVISAFIAFTIALGPTTKTYVDRCQITIAASSVLLVCADKSRILTEVPVGFNDSTNVEIRGWYSIAGFKTVGDIYIDGKFYR